MSLRICVAALSLMLAVAGRASGQLTNTVFAAEGAESVQVFVDGNLRSAIAQTNQTTVAAGALGVGWMKRTLLVGLLINAAGTTAPLTANQATTLLAPASGGSLSAGYGEVRFRPGKLVGLRSYVSVSTANWTDTLSKKTVGALVGGVGLGVFVSPFGGTVGTPAGNQKVTHVAAVLDFGPMWRTLGGDIAEDTNRQELLDIMGNATRDRFGLEVGVTLQVNDLKAGFTYYFLGGQVPGLSRGQVVAGFSVGAPLISGALNNDK